MVASRAELTSESGPQTATNLRLVPAELGRSLGAKLDGACRNSLQWRDSGAVARGRVLPEAVSAFARSISRPARERLAGVARILQSGTVAFNLASWSTKLSQGLRRLTDQHRAPLGQPGAGRPGLH